MGVGGLAFACLLAEAERTCAGAPDDRLVPPQPHFPGKARRVIHLFMEGDPSHLDTFDPKPELSARDGQSIPRPGGERPGRVFGSPFAFG
jgi:hypothetical protein